VNTKKKRNRMKCVRITENLKSRRQQETGELVLLINNGWLHQRDCIMKAFDSIVSKKHLINVRLQSESAKAEQNRTEQYRGSTPD
jgi:hypothetical protein